MTIKSTTSGARFISDKEKFDGSNYTAFELTYTGRTGREARAAMKQRLAEAKKAAIAEPVSVGYIKVNF